MSDISPKEFIEERKAQLKQKRDRYQELLESELTKYNVSPVKARNLLLAAGGITATVIIAGLVFKYRAKPKASAQGEVKSPARQEAPPSAFNQVRGQVAMFLLGFARRKLKEYLNDKDTDTDDVKEHI